MDAGATTSETRASTGRKRVPKSCNPCRQSKTRCDESKPACGRCQALKKTCIYVEKPKTAEEQRIEDLEHEVLTLQQQLQVQSTAWNSSRHGAHGLTSQVNPDITSPQSMTSVNLSSPSTTTERPLKRKRSHFHLQKEIVVPDFVTEGILSEHQAALYFNCFFDGCDRYVPIFDLSDTFHSVRSRSSLLLNSICAVGCGMSEDASVDNRALHVKLKRWLTIVILSPHVHALETVQALLIMACWMPERNLILAVATRMALELRLDDAFDSLVNLSLNRPSSPESFVLMKRARTWFGLLVLEKILQVDAGNLLGLKLKGVRRCRTLLDRPYSAKLDPRLFSQAELNHLRAKINDNLITSADDVLQAVQDARVDIDVWYHDWKRIMETSPLSGSELPSLITNLLVQKHWADAMACCRAVRATGVHNIDVMSDDQKQVLNMAKDSLQRHLDVVLTQPTYISNFKYAMDFVWAKCAFSFLLLLKLTILLPDTEEQDLLQQGRALYQQLEPHARYGSSKVYLRLLQLSIEKFVSRNDVHSAELDSFVPDEFIFEWDFPGLNLFSSPTGWDLLFDQYLLGDDLFAGIGT